MSEDYPEPPRTDWAELALLSEADDPEDYRDVWGAVQDGENFRRLQEQVIVPFDTYDDFPEEGPFDGARAEAKEMNVVFQWDADAEDWTPLNTGTSEDPVPGTSHYESVETEQADVNEYPKGHWGLKFGTRQFFDRPGHDSLPYRSVRDLRPDSIMLRTDTSGTPATHTTLTDRASDRVYIDRPGKGIEEQEFVFDMQDGVLLSAVHNSGEWLIFDASRGSEGRFLVYDSSDDFGDDANAIGVEDNAYGPFRQSIAAFDNGETGWLFTEYNTDEHDPRIYRVQTDGTIEVKETVPESRHGHSMDEDIHNPGEFYATFGDSDSYWYYSDDHGETWTEIIDGKGLVGDNEDARRWQVLRLSFTEDHIWWGTDGFEEDGWSKLYRAERGNEDDPEEIAKLSQSHKIYGQCLLREGPHGLLIAGRETEGDTNYAPFWFYSFQHEELKEVGSLWLGEDNNGGPESIAPYRDNGSGKIWMKTDNVAGQPRWVDLINVMSGH